MDNQDQAPKQLILIGEYIMKCPVCGRNLVNRDYKYNIPYVGDIVITVAQCENCGFKNSDVFVLGSGEPRKVIYRVEEPGDDNALVIRSSTCKVEIPELDVTIEPTTYSRGYITTVEGLVDNILSVAKSLCSSEDAPRDKCQEVLTRIEKALSNEIPYTVILYDYLGVCDIVSRKKKPIYERLETQ